ncbi:MAG: polyribonucleotide nucleotidyltransferase [Ardenticatenia bacterium]|nr:MAG: polyribonucleotide nucleotidyltransferase [Ardenticatenia bacterium]
MTQEPKTYTTTLGDKEIIIQTGLLAPQADGAVTVRMGDSMVLVTAVAAKEPRPGITFFPLTVDFEERLYAIGRIPGSFFRREGRPSESAILYSRLIDRSLRPLFPKGFRNDVQIIVTPLSYDQEHPLDTLGVIGASAALSISGIPFEGPIGHVRISLDDEGNFLINPTVSQYENSRLDLRVSGTADAINMVECASNEVDEETMLRALELAHRAFQPVIALQNRMKAEIGKPEMPYEVYKPGDEVAQRVREWLGGRVEEIIASAMSKEERNDALAALGAELAASFYDEVTGEYEFPLEDITTVYDDVVKETVRRRILEEGIRPDGRKPHEIRPLFAAVGISPRSHGSGLFQRGETQVLSIATLGTMGEEQMLDDLGVMESKRYMHHYNFPPFSTGEARPLRGPRRREIGHGNLAENALRPMIPDEKEFPYTIRVVSEVLSSNGSTSMASVCASTLALMDAGVPIKKPVAGIAMGLISDPETNRFVVLTDIQGMEDHLGDMDFKVAGTRDGINALQMDIKIKGLDIELLRQALAQARDARLAILDVMLETIPEPRAELSPYAPRIFTMSIPVDKIGALIGPGGKHVRSIQEETGVKVDIAEDGTVYLAATDGEAAKRAEELVRYYTEDVEVGKIYTGKVVRVTDFGAFVQLRPGQEGLVHISQLADRRVDKVEDVVKVGDEIMVMVINIDPEGKIRLSRQAVLEGWTLEEAQAADRGSRRPSGDGRRGRDGGRRGGGGGRRGGGGGRGGRR